MDSAFTLRFAFPDDDEAIARLAVLDSATVPPGPLLVAECDGELRAALSLHDGSTIADPFHHTAALVELLRTRAAQLGRTGSAWAVRWPLRRAVRWT